MATCQTVGAPSTRSNTLYVAVLASDTAGAIVDPQDVVQFRLILLCGHFLDLVIIVVFFFLIVTQEDLDV